jgi:hypothetical protein
MNRWLTCCKDHLKIAVLTTSVLITGASGLIGTRLTEMFLQKGYRVAHLGRTRRNGPVPSFVWDIAKQTIDPEALSGIDTIIHLAGAGVADQRWTPARKKEIMDSRVLSTELLYQSLKSIPNEVRSVVGASAIGYYGFGPGHELLNEDSVPGNDFLSQVVVAWEQKMDQVITLQKRVAKIRIGIVLSERGGALMEMARPVRFGVGSSLGKGTQMVSWIHIDDLCRLFIKATDDQSMEGAYNGVAPNAVTNRDLTKAIAQVLHRPLWAPAVPGFVLHILLGEMADLIIQGSNVSAARTLQSGFQYAFTDVTSAVKDLLARA